MGEVVVVGASATSAGEERLLAGSAHFPREERTLLLAPNAPGLHDPKSIELRKSFGITFINSFEYHLYIVPEGIVNSQKMHMHICLCQKYPQMQLSSFETHILSLIVSL